VEECLLVSQLKTKEQGANYLVWQLEVVDPVHEMEAWVVREYLVHLNEQEALVVEVYQRSEQRWWKKSHLQNSWKHPPPEYKREKINSIAPL
jgi:hypothetical protein